MRTIEHIVERLLEAQESEFGEVKEFPATPDMVLKTFNQIYANSVREQWKAVSEQMKLSLETLFEVLQSVNHDHHDEEKLAVLS